MVAKRLRRTRGLIHPALIPPKQRPTERLKQQLSVIRQNGACALKHHKAARPQSLIGEHIGAAHEPTIKLHLHEQHRTIEMREIENRKIVHRL